MLLQAENSPLVEPQVDLLNQVLPTLTPEQQTWLSGYLAGLQAAGGTATLLGPEVQNGSANEQISVTVLYGSQTGNAQGIAEDLAERLKAQGYGVELVSMLNYKINKLKKARILLVLVSTHGEGDPPDNAIPFYEQLFGNKAPKLSDLQYSVLALGDSSYEHFCQTGIEFDKRLTELGAARLTARVDCDVDYDEPSEAWISDVMSALPLSDSTPAAAAIHSPPRTSVGSAQPASHSRKSPFQAEVLENINLNWHGSGKETRHLELAIEGSGLVFEPGDALGIFPQNDPALVDELIAEMGWNPDQAIDSVDGERTLRDTLTRDYEITVLTKPLIESAAQLMTNGLQKLVTDRDALRNYMEGRDLLDLIRDHKLQEIPATELLSILRKMPPRLYSIANSHRANPDEVHLTIAAVRFQSHGRARAGVTSVQCAERLELGDTLPVYVQRNPNFRLPEDPTAPVIMIGPGTGVAPFRAFLDEREETGATGKNWLIYGDRHFYTDFMYQIEWQRWLDEGLLTRLDVAFSRDSAQRVYVQHRMHEQSAELFRWFEDGAHLYVCGDEKHMAPDVHRALEEIVACEGNMSAEAANEYVVEMQKSQRYQRDVY